VAELDHIVVTGAAGAIGGALARALAARHPAARLSLVDVAPADELARAIGERACALHWDLAEPDRLEAELGALVAARGPIDALVNAAGIMDVGWFAATGWSDARRLLDIDLVSPLRLMNLVAPGMAERGRGAIVNLTSMAGRTPLRGCSYYGAAKAGLAMASEIAHLELATRGVHVVTVYPGPVSSALERRARAALAAGRLARIVPVGDAAVLARHILRALDRGQPRVIYPTLYAAADRALALTRWLTSRFSPPPIQGTPIQGTGQRVPTSGNHTVSGGM
jgi:short-subunit dehydrogenase